MLFDIDVGCIVGDVVGCDYLVVVECVGDLVEIVNGDGVVIVKVGECMCKLDIGDVGKCVGGVDVREFVDIVCYD